MRRARAMAAAAAALGLTLLAGPGGPPLPAAGAEIEVIARALPDRQAPVIDGRVDRLWESARAVRFTVSEGTQGTVEVTLRALRSGTHLYLLVQWADDTESLNRFLESRAGEWRPARGREDRLNIAWDIGGSVAGFPQQGCSALCHKTEGVMRTSGPGEKIDLWYWMAHRTNPLGVADDWVMGHEARAQEGKKTARRPDAPEGGPWESNFDEAARIPRFMPKPGAKPARFLLRAEAMSVTQAAALKPGDRLPREVLAPPAGRRAGIEARGVWHRGTWTVELKRALRTDDPDDVQFSGPGPFYFAVSIHDDAEEDEHAQMGRDVLRLHFR